MNTTIYAIDYESFYSKDISITTLGVHAYLRHPECDIYLVSIVGDDGFEFVGHPTEAPWEKLHGATLLSHNRTFDKACMDRCRELGQPTPDYVEWHCTADMCAGLGIARSLEAASVEILGYQPNKATRANMKGRRIEALNPEDHAELLNYALVDSRLCLALWQELSDQWSLEERHYSAHTTLMCHRGIGLDLEATDKAIKTLEKTLWECRNTIPWSDKTDSRGKPYATTSPKQMHAECARLGIPAPPNVGETEAFAKWMGTYGEQAPFVQAVRDYRSINRTLELVKKLKVSAPNGRLKYGLKYFGAHTGRWSGDSGINMQNFPRDEKFGVNLRHLFIPEEGKKFVIADYAQIEARVLLWLAGDHAQLDIVRNGTDVYEAHARQTMGYTDPRPLKDVDPHLRQYAKARVLGLGYGCGDKKFRILAKSMCGLDLTQREASKTVYDYRRQNPKIIALWNQLDRAFKRSKGTDYQVELPSGRVLTYTNVISSGGWRAKTTRGGKLPPSYLYGGLLVENLVQATARDIMAEAIFRLESAGFPVVLHIHDEVVCEVPKHTDPKAIEHCMTQLPDWAQGLPLEAEAEETTKYKK